MSGDILYDGVNVGEQEDDGFTGSFFKTNPIIIDDTTKNKLTKIRKTPLLNIDKQQLNTMICENMDKK